MRRTRSRSVVLSDVSPRAEGEGKSALRCGRSTSYRDATRSSRRNVARALAPDDISPGTAPGRARVCPGKLFLCEQNPSSLARAHNARTCTERR